MQLRYQMGVTFFNPPWPIEIHTTVQWQVAEARFNGLRRSIHPLDASVNKKLEKNVSAHFRHNILCFCLHNYLLHSSTMILLILTFDVLR